MKTPILIAIILLAFVGIVALVAMLLMRRLNAKFSGGDESENPNITEAQQLLPFEDIREGVIVMSDNRFRAVIECSSVNYTLKTDGERDLIEMSFQQFLNSLPCAITIFTQTKLIDNTRRQRLLEKSIEEVTEEYPAMSEYAEQYRKDMANLTNCIGNSTQKKRYIIVPYDEVNALGELSQEEKVHYAVREIRNRCNIIKANLEQVGVNTHLLDTKELVELIYSSYHRDDYSYAEAIADGDAFALFVDGEKDRFANLPQEATLDQILAESINRIQLGGHDRSPEGKELLMSMQELRNRYAGYFKQNDDSESETKEAMDNGKE